MKRAAMTKDERARLASWLRHAEYRGKTGAIDVALGIASRHMRERKTYRGMLEALAAIVAEALDLERQVRK